MRIQNKGPCQAQMCNLNFPDTLFDNENSHKTPIDSSKKCCVEQKKRFLPICYIKIVASASVIGEIKQQAT